MKRLVIIAVVAFALTGCAQLEQQFDQIMPPGNQNPPVAPHIDPPTYPPCDPATGYLQAGPKGDFYCVTPPMRTDCTDGQVLAKSGEFACLPPPDTIPPGTADPTIPTH